MQQASGEVMQHTGVKILHTLSCFWWPLPRRSVFGLCAAMGLLSSLRAKTLPYASLENAAQGGIVFLIAFVTNTAATATTATATADLEIPSTFVIFTINLQLSNWRGIIKLADRLGGSIQRG